MAAELFRVNYYVSGLIAQGGNLWIDRSIVFFSPTSAFDRAMGAKEVEIPFEKIKEMGHPGTLSRTITIHTDNKVHKFEGAQVQRLWDILTKLLPNKGSITKPAAAPQRISLTCENCTKTLQPGFYFCPHCANRLKSVCRSCHRSADPAWTACGYCGTKLAA